MYGFIAAKRTKMPDWQYRAVLAISSMKSFFQNLSKEFDLQASFWAVEMKLVWYRRRSKHIARGSDLKTITWCIYLVLD